MRQTVQLRSIVPKTEFRAALQGPDFCTWLRIKCPTATNIQHFCSNRFSFINQIPKTTHKSSLKELRKAAKNRHEKSPCCGKLENLPQQVFLPPVFYAIGGFGICAQKACYREAKKRCASIQSPYKQPRTEHSRTQYATTPMPTRALKNTFAEKFFAKRKTKYHFRTTHNRSIL